jgi:UDP-N-acetylglucosamine--N-acetylmuramyl-(pentapeptide) pyrophosphoryl-undecaprenol N-acetylglucosamine transferase
LQELSQADIQIIWQTGKFYIEEARKAAEPFSSPQLIVTDFVSRMDLAYSVADLVISRAGASSISELCLLGKPAYSGTFTQCGRRHQTKNALALVQKEAAVMIKDDRGRKMLIPKALE